MKVLLIGADGYMGWPLACQLADNPNVSKLTLLDNLITRLKVKEVGGNSVLPINEYQQRSDKLAKKYKNKNISFIVGSVTKMELVTELSKQKFDVIYHLGHLRTAPYSMLSHEACVETVINNEIGFLNLIWALKDNSRDTLLIKLGSFGAYAPTGLKIPESDIYLIQQDSEKSKVKVPYPKMAFDFYHLTKANDSLFGRVACRNWGLRIIDVMQSTVFGVSSHYTEKMAENTRLDYDQIYGTVLNRFILQGLMGMPLSVYGDGQHSSGIMVLKDAIAVLSKLATESLSPGEFRVINNNPRSYKIIELAKKVETVLSAKGIKVEISVDEFDPRNEKNEKAEYYTTTADSQFFRNNFIETPLENEIKATSGILKDHLASVNREVIYPTLVWST